MIDLRRILVPTDFSKYSDAALTYAGAFAQKFGADIYLLHVVQDLTLFYPEAVLAAPAAVPTVDQFRQAARTALDRTLAGLRLPDVVVHPVVVEGTPYDAVVRFAGEKEIDLIVMGTHGRSGLAHLFMGSVAEKVVRKAPCPVLTVRQPEHEFVKP
jgi:nucleotide-binding universal stress UspA family protein